MTLFVLPIGDELAFPTARAVHQPPLSLSGVSTPAAALSMEEAVEAAVANNRRIAAAARDVIAARQGVRSAGALTNPNLLFTPALTGGVGGGSDTEVLVQQPLEINGIRTARRGAASAQSRRAAALAVVELRSVVFAARSAYLEVARAREQSVLARTLFQTAEELDRVARRQVELGTRPAIEQTQTGIEVTRAKQQAALARAAVTSSEAALNSVMNRSPNAPVGTVALPDVAAVFTAPLPDLQDVIRRALAQRTEIAAAEAASDAFRQEARLARAEGIPDIAPQWRAGSVTRGVQQSGFGIGITLPLFDYGSRRGRVRQAEASSRAEGERVEAARVQVQQEAVQALARATAAREVLATYPEGLLDEAARLLRASRVGYEEGRTSIIQLVEAQRTYRQVQNDFITAQVEYALALAEMERAGGSFPTAALPTSLDSIGQSQRRNP
ncbi:MAG: TolC family protein [Armatimonadota bacterium]